MKEVSWCVVSLLQRRSKLWGSLLGFSAVIVCASRSLSQEFLPKEFYFRDCVEQGYTEQYCRYLSERNIQPYAQITNIQNSQQQLTTALAFSQSALSTLVGGDEYLNRLYALTKSPLGLSAGCTAFYGSNYLSSCLQAFGLDNTNESTVLRLAQPFAEAYSSLAPALKEDIQGIASQSQVKAVSEALIGITGIYGVSHLPLKNLVSSFPVTAVTDSNILFSSQHYTQFLSPVRPPFLNAAVLGLSAQQVNLITERFRQFLYQADLNSLLDPQRPLYRVQVDIPFNENQGRLARAFSAVSGSTAGDLFKPVFCEGQVCPHIELNLSGSGRQILEGEKFFAWVTARQKVLGGVNWSGEEFTGQKPFIAESNLKFVLKPINFEEENRGIVNFMLCAQIRYRNLSGQTLFASPHIICDLPITPQFATIVPAQVRETEFIRANLDIVPVKISRTIKDLQPRYRNELLRQFKEEKRKLVQQDQVNVKDPANYSKNASEACQKGKMIVASFYGGHFHGRRTANGEIYNINALTAAHKKLQFGTRVAICSPRTGKTVVVRINDRGPFIPGRELDLSPAAVKQLGHSLGEGLYRLHMIILS